MPLLRTRTYRLYEFLLIVVLFAFAVPAEAQQQRIVVAVIEDGPSERLASLQQIYIDE